MDRAWIAWDRGGSPWIAWIAWIAVDRVDRVDRGLDPNGSSCQGMPKERYITQPYKKKVGLTHPFPPTLLLGLRGDRGVRVLREALAQAATPHAPLKPNALGRRGFLSLTTASSESEAAAQRSRVTAKSRQQNQIYLGQRGGAGTCSDDDDADSITGIWQRCKGRHPAGERGVGMRGQARQKRK
eukprot:scaffold15055_cov121-Isochrysis_galbana.AAC.10